MLRSFLLLVFILLGYSVSWASPNNFQQRGEATFRWFGIPVYDARLFTPGGAALNWQQDLTLELTYRRALARQSLIDSTQSEMQRLGYTRPQDADLQSCFRNVRPGDTFRAQTEGADQLRLYLNGAEVCRLAQPDIRRGFMSIFLSDNSRAPNVSRHLRNE
ncbi:hypothetical protein [Cochlodiniinecator piscidefendens]|uniref:hypothetical protein n=1 Tax=Cochlodiniinecator piscidefendens TaxID=2715756 RepID=UPI00140A99DF|nr:hypothetical protein [Cochlodiniinecator piscidefendens]